MLHLDPLNKVMVMAGAAAAVVVTILMVVCFVGDGCLFHDLISSKKKRQGRKLSGGCRYTWCQPDGLLRMWKKGHGAYS